jgi:hypothetical protein
MYSNDVTPWDGTATALGVRKGWMGQLWTALVDGSTTEPGPDNSDWQLDTETNITGITFEVIPDPIDYLQAKITGITFEKQHSNKPESVYLGGITFIQRRNKPYKQIVIF